MPKVIDSEDPARTDYRMIQYLLRGKKVQHLPNEYEHVLTVFAKMGGKWEKVMKGSVQQTALLKKILKVGIKKGWISKAPKWG